jgi:hypothetical protein
MRVNIDPLIKFCGTRPDNYRDDPAADTKRVGLPVVGFHFHHISNSLPL